MYVYQKVRLYLEENGIKQVSVAQKAGISIATFYAILNGKEHCMQMTLEQFVMR